jgi:DNA processing protein
MDAKTEFVRLNDRQRRDWLRLIRTENVGPRTFRSLINEFGTAARAIERLPDLAQRGGRSLQVVSEDEAQIELAAAAKIGVRFIAVGEREYPPLLRETIDAPPLLAVRGQLDVLTRPAIAIVGSRNASAAGSRFASLLARDLGTAGFVVVSGLARGIDSAAHRASIESGTIAVLAGGSDRIYPPEHTELETRLTAQGASVSEMPIGWEPRARDFPRRNRIIAGMSYGVVVVEAAERSGSLITARMANEIGREVFAVPGSPIDPRSGGTNKLIRDGATLVTSAADVVEVLTPIMGRSDPRAGWREPPAEPASSPEPSAADDALRSRVAELLSPAPVSIDELARSAKASAGAIQIVLLELELAGRIERHGGSLVSLR